MIASNLDQNEVPILKYICSGVNQPPAALRPASQPVENAACKL
jgi:hypothetical protein